MKPLDKTDLSKTSKVRKNKVLKKSKVELKNPRFWENTQGMVALVPRPARQIAHAWAPEEET